MAEQDITPGTPEFDKMVFKLAGPITAANQTAFKFKDETLTEIQPGVYVLPVLLQPDFNLFLVGAQLVGKDWVLCFSQATIENDNEVTDLTEPEATGHGLNQLGFRDPQVANELLQYFERLLTAGLGEWKLIK
ncbi:hypothetical protein M3M35_01855 [Fructilactobacillus myrtifloralis]|uniref:Uncharacterized protein n=1 Tax=Fructilactobacillus myrtifloralis TaxID=2940301 RepID=A0ABY5BSU1_9LACO|nr:hypothetical protein [Fructilactobacillus myrtifloralis]USS85434.1 hypothetical protein M3M35_01855 [Fructilactobacillus myrtifloralis]